MQDAATSTIGTERWSNPLFAISEGSAFHDQLVAGFMPYPTYYREMAGLNRAGPPLLGERPALAPLDPAAVAQALASGATLVDARSRAAITAAHIPSSLTVELRDTFASYVGWIVPVGTPLVLVLPDTPGAADEAVDQLVRIGFDRLVGVLDGGVERWAAEGRPVAEIATVTASTLADELRAGDRPLIVDVRDEAEMRADGRLDDAVALPLAGLIAGKDLALPAGRRGHRRLQVRQPCDGRRRPARGARAPGPPRATRRDPGRRRATGG